MARKQLKVYKEFLAISLTSEPKEMLRFSQQCHDNIYDNSNSDFRGRKS